MCSSTLSKNLTKDDILMHTCRVFPLGSEIQRGSLMSSHEKMAGSFLYATPVTVLTLVRTVCKKKKEGHKTTTDHEQLDFES
jgi:hypothetical protein